LLYFAILYLVLNRTLARVAKSKKEVIKLSKEQKEKIGLENLKEVYQKEVANETFQLPVLENHVVDLAVFTPEMAEIKAKELREKEVPKLEEEMKADLTWLEALVVSDRDKREVMEYAVKQSGRKHPQQWLEEILDHSFAPYRRTAWVTLLQFYFQKEMKSREEAQGLLGFLVRKGYLVEEKEGFVEAYWKKYGLPIKAAEVLDGESELGQLVREFNGLLWRVRQAEKKTTQEKGKTLLSKGKLSWKDFLGGKEGLFAVEVPGEREARRTGGVLLVRSDGQRVFPLEAVGGFEEAIEEAKKLRVFLLLQSLFWERPPYVEAVDAKKGTKIALLWHLLKSGISPLKEKEARQTLREEMKAAAPLTPEEFFLEKKLGVAFVEYGGSWKWETSGGEVTQVENLFFSVERQEKGDQSIIRLVTIPPWLKEFFSNCQGEFREGERFEGIPQPLQSVLRRIWGQVQKHTQIANHAV